MISVIIVLEGPTSGAARDHAGIIVSVQPGHRMYRERLRRLFRLLDTLTADGMTNRLEWLDRHWSEASPTR